MQSLFGDTIKDRLEKISVRNGIDTEVADLCSGREVIWMVL